MKFGILFVLTIPISAQVGAEREKLAATRQTFVPRQSNRKQEQ